MTRLAKVALSTLAIAAVLAAGAMALTVPPHGGAGRGCTPHRLDKAVVELPHGASLVLRHPLHGTRVRYSGGWNAFHIRANKHDVAVVSDSAHELVLHARCHG